MTYTCIHVHTHKNREAHQEAGEAQVSQFHQGLSITLGTMTENHMRAERRVVSALQRHDRSGSACARLLSAQAETPPLPFRERVALVTDARFPFFNQELPL